VQALRVSHPRAYESWAAQEEAALEEAFHAHIDLDEIATALQRSRGAVYKQLVRMGLIR
jgi:hypothetical protein